ncbi:hypothetical protein K2X33_09790 [bacterium]|nr:hypothetical protein [bacterium]
MRLLVLSIGLLSSALQAAPLSKYRDALGSRVKAETQAAQRVTSLRKDLGTSERPAVDASGALGKLASQALKTGEKKSFSNALKRVLSQAAGKLEDNDTYGEPQKFDPSKFLSELEADKANRYLTFCEKHLEKDFERLRDELVVLVTEQSQPRTVGEGDRAFEKELAAAVEKALPADLLQRLGHVHRVDFADGEMLRVHFTKNPAITLDASNSDASESLPLSLSMLTTYRTGKDKYYILVLHCFDRYLQKVRDSQTASEDQKKFSEFVQDAVAKRRTGAESINGLLRQLSNTDLNNLIDFFLQVNVKSIPTEDELTPPDEPNNWKPGTSDSLAGYFFFLTEPKLQERGKSLAARDAARAAGLTAQETAAKQQADTLFASVAEPLADYQHYELLDTQLAELQEYLVSERERLEAEKALLKDMAEAVK